MITSTSSSQVKTVVSLQKKAKTRKETKQFVVEGMKMVSEVPQDRLVKVYFFGKLCSGKRIVFKQICKRTDGTCQRYRFRANVRYQDTAGCACHCKNGTIYGAGYDER